MLRDHFTQFSMGTLLYKLCFLFLPYFLHILGCTYCLPVAGVNVLCLRVFVNHVLNMFSPFMSSLRLG